MSYYTDIKKRNLIRTAGALINNGSLTVRESDARLKMNLEIDTKGIWSHVKIGTWCNCDLWALIAFDGIIKKLPPDQWFVPIACQTCFKVVVRPQTLKGLFALEKIQIALNHPSKCGLEVRPYVFGIYGGYFYNQSFADGAKCYKMVTEAIKNDGYLGPHIKEYEKKLGRELIVLKRGCTEYEMALGDSDKWTLSAENMEFNAILSERLVVDQLGYQQSDFERDNAHHTWMETAWASGDETVLEYMDGQPLYPEYVTYHHLAEEGA